MSIAGDAKAAVQGAVQGLMQKAIEVAPESWLPGGRPDPLIREQHGQVGRAVSRVDGPLKVKGAARFAAEFAPEGVTYAALVFSTVPKGRVGPLDLTAAQSAEGVILVMTHENAPRMEPTPRFMSAAKAAGGDDLPVMQDDRVHWNGQPVALVLAETQEQADHAASLIVPTYETEEAVTSFAEAERRGTEPGNFQGEPLKIDKNDAEQRLADAAFKVEEHYSTPRHNHNPIEPHAITVAWEGDDALRVHDTTQAVTHTAWSLAQIFGLDEDKVRVTSPYVGGGFGSKTLWQHQVLAAAAAKLAQRPVRLTLSREGVYRLVGGRSPTEQRVGIGADADGRFTAIVHTGSTVMSHHSALPEPFIVATRSLYASQSFLLDTEVARMDMLANTFMRAPGEAVGTFALECAIDELAEKMGIDPIELRRRNEPDKDPESGADFSMRNLPQAFAAGAERFGWNRRQAPGTRREGEWLVGMGCATATYPYNRMPGGAARIRLSDAGALVSLAAHEMGMGTATAHAMVAADRLGLPLEQVTLDYGDSAMPGVVLAGGSQQTAAIGAAVMAAQQALFRELLKLAGNDSPLAGLGLDEVEGADGGIRSTADPSRHESYRSILARAQRDEVTVEAEAPAPLESQKWSMHSYGAMFCEARVNTVTGEPRITRFLTSMDCGRILNAKTAASQFRGGIIMGLGLALMEETQFDERNGRIMNPSLAEYHLPVHLDVPPIEVMWLDIPDPHAPMGAHGVGEIGITGVGAAVANAIYNATGRRVRDLPLTLDKLM